MKLLLALSLRALSASAEPAEPDRTAETPKIPTAPIVAPRQIRDEGVAYLEQALGERFSERVEVRLIPELDTSGHFRSSSVETQQGHDVDEEGTPPAREQLFEPALRAGMPVPTHIRYRAGGLSEIPLAPGLRRLLRLALFLFGPEAKLDHPDYQTRATHQPSARDRFRVFGLSSHHPRDEKRKRILRRVGDACRPKITLTW